MEKILTNRVLKKQIREILKSAENSEFIQEISKYPAKRIINPLFSFLCETDEIIKWRGITAMGIVSARLAYCDIDSALVIMRRLMWSLNDESGGIGWGAPEAMGEIMAEHKLLAKKYHKILISYTMPHGNFIEHEILQRGVLWGTGRLFHARPYLIQSPPDHFIPYLKSQDNQIRGLGAWVLSAFNQEIVSKILNPLKSDPAKIKFYHDWILKTVSVGSLASGKL